MHALANHFGLRSCWHATAGNWKWQIARAMTVLAGCMHCVLHASELQGKAHNTTLQLCIPGAPPLHMPASLLVVLADSTFEAGPACCSSRAAVAACRSVGEQALRDVVMRVRGLEEAGTINEWEQEEDAANSVLPAGYAVEPGSVVSSQDWPEFGAKELLLSNGMKVGCAGPIYRLHAFREGILHGLVEDVGASAALAASIRMVISMPWQERQAARSQQRCCGRQDFGVRCAGKESIPFESCDFESVTDLESVPGDASSFCIVIIWYASAVSCLLASRNCMSAAGGDVPGVPAGMRRQPFTPSCASMAGCVPALSSMCCRAMAECNRGGPLRRWCSRRLAGWTTRCS